MLKSLDSWKMPNRLKIRGTIRRSERRVNKRLYEKIDEMKKDKEFMKELDEDIKSQKNLEEFIEKEKRKLINDIR